MTGETRASGSFRTKAFASLSVTRTRTVLTQSARQGLFRYVGSTGATETVNLLNIGSVKTLNPVTSAQLNAYAAAKQLARTVMVSISGFRYNVGARSE